MFTCLKSPYNLSLTSLPGSSFKVESLVFASSNSFEAKLRVVVV
jgi:hypothetical protein